MCFCTMYFVCLTSLRGVSPCVNRAGIAGFILNSWESLLNKFLTTCEITHIINVTTYNTELLQCVSISGIVFQWDLTATSV